MLLRSEPAGSASAARASALGINVRSVPLFAVKPAPWKAPDPALYDALLLTSANALLHGGAELARLKSLPVFAVGASTATAARDVGFEVAEEGGGGVAALLAVVPSGIRLLHLAGRDRIIANQAAQRIDTLIVYAAEALPKPAGVDGLAGCVVALHSPRAAARLAALMERTAVDRASIALLALSPAVADAAGGGWERVAVASSPTDAALLALAAELCL